MLRLTFSSSAAYLAFIGTALIFFPIQFGVGAVPPDASPELIALLRLMGGPFLGIASLNWLSRDAAPLAVKSILIANLIGFGAVSANDVWGIATGESREVAKLFVIVHLLFTLAFALAAGRAWRAAETLQSP